MAPESAVLPGALLASPEAGDHILSETAPNGRWVAI